MSFKAKKSKATKTDLFSDIDLFTGSKVPVKDRKRIAEEIAEIITDETLKAVGNAKSPLAGKGAFEKLSPTYKSKKEKANLTGKPNLEFEGDLLDAFTVKATRSGVRVGYENSSQAPKADGHNNFSGKSSLPLRRYIPEQGEAYKSSIDKKIRELVTEAQAKNLKLPKRLLSNITTKAQFFNVMSERMPGATRAEIKRAISLDEDLLLELGELGLLDMIG